MKDNLLRQCIESYKQPGGRAVIAYFDASIENEKERLIKAKGGEIAEIQGFIKKLRKHIDRIKQTHVVTQKTGAYSG